MALTTEEATAFIKGKSLLATRLAGGTPSLQFKDNGTMYGQKTITTAAAVIRGSGGLKTASCACAGSGGNTKAAASWFEWRAKSITFTRMPARYILFLTTKTEVCYVFSSWLRIECGGYMRFYSVNQELTALQPKTGSVVVANLRYFHGATRQAVDQTVLVRHPA